MSAAEYARRRPEEDLVRRHLRTFLAEGDARAVDGRSLPRYVRGAFERPLDRGVLSKGFARVRGLFPGDRKQRLDRPVCLSYHDFVRREKDKTESGAYGRILETASELFYRNGYRATGINEIIEKSGVAKATFYAHFPSKELLALAYMKAMNETEARGLETGLAKYHGPYEKLLGILEYSVPWSRERDYRGCGYLNMSSEVTDPASPLRQESKNHYDTLRALAGVLMKELKAERGSGWKDRDPDKLADSFMLIFAGAMALAQVYYEPKPFREAQVAVRRLLA